MMASEGSNRAPGKCVGRAFGGGGNNNSGKCSGRQMQGVMAVIVSKGGGDGKSVDSNSEQMRT